ncbi:MAG: hypothetical protein D6741_13200 [Planctomycetota bacterium]|nr:MAG: hypothetical protein D6741_13200 [Planctomycetota bacterium]
MDFRPGTPSFPARTGTPQRGASGGDHKDALRASPIAEHRPSGPRDDQARRKEVAEPSAPERPDGSTTTQDSQGRPNGTIAFGRALPLNRLDTAGKLGIIRTGSLDCAPFPGYSKATAAPGCVQADFRHPRGRLEATRRRRSRDATTQKRSAAKEACGWGC